MSTTRLFTVKDEMEKAGGLHHAHRPFLQEPAWAAAMSIDPNVAALLGKATLP